MNPEATPRVSIIIPCRNEVRGIVGCLESIRSSTYPAHQLEILVADGRSDDGTQDVLRRYADADPRIRVIDNVGQTAPAGLNAGIRQASGEVVMRMDAHASYPPEYISRLVAALLESGADNVGAPVVTVPIENTATARAVALGLAHPLGVGNSRFRIGASQPVWVDHVPFGCWRRTVLEQLGPFDEELTRGQDVEMNARILASGGRILLIADVVTTYHARRTVGQLGRMMYQYGYFKPLIGRKCKRLLTLRQLAPPALLLGLTVGFALLPWTPVPFVALAGTYLALIATGVAMAAAPHGLSCAGRLFAVLPAMHLSYGTGYLHGLFHHFARRGRAVRPARAITLTR